MSNILERWFNYDHRQAMIVEREIKVWLAYLGMLCFGGVIFAVPLTIWFDRYTTGMRSQYQAEIQRQQETNGQLLAIIQDRLPAITQTAATAAETAKTAAETAKSAAQTARAASTGAGKAAKVASGAAVEAKTAATTVKGAAEDLTQALTPVPAPPAKVPDWLNTP